MLDRLENKKSGWLFPLAWLFGLAVGLRNFFYDWKIFPVRTLPGKVISVGNIALGGTGKSPMVIAVAEDLVGRRVVSGIVTRGYKGGLKSREWVCYLNGVRIAGNASESANPDEAIMQSQMLPEVPVIVGARRFHAVQGWLDYCKKSGIRVPQVYILDDGFQHRAIHRDLNLLLLDSEKPFGPLIPQGRFREPPESMYRADVVVFTRATDRLPRAGDFAYPNVLTNACVVKSSMQYGDILNVSGERNQRDLEGFFGVCGIAQPDSFFRVLDSKNLKVKNRLVLGDHDTIELERLVETNKDRLPVITTMKDWHRLKQVFEKSGFSIWILPMSVELPKEVSQKIQMMLSTSVS